MSQLTDNAIRNLVSQAVKTAMERPGFVGDIVGNGSGEVLSAEVSQPGTSNLQQIRVKTRTSGTFYVEVKVTVKY